jgi:hypothetical protein
LPLKADCTLTTSSGALVPNATTVSPTTKGEIPIPTANREAPRTRSSAPIVNTTNPKISQNRVKALFLRYKTGRHSSETATLPSNHTIERTKNVHKQGDFSRRIAIFFKNSPLA